MFWNEYRIHKTSKFGLFVNEIKLIKFWFTIAKFCSYLIATVIGVDANYSFEIKNIEIWEPAFFKYNNSSIATVHLKALDLVQVQDLYHNNPPRW